MNAPRSWPVAQLATGALVVIAPQLLGGVAAWSISVILALSVLAYLACHYQAYGADRERLGWDPLMWLMLASLGWTGLQALPLPCAVVAWVAPDAARHVAENATLLGGEPGMCHLSRDPGATRMEVLKGLAIVLGFLCGRWLARLGARRTVYMAAAASSCAMALVALGHWGAQAEAVYGVYTPRTPGQALFIAPLINSNNLGGFLAMGVPLCLGMGAESADRVVRQAWRGAAVVVSATAVLSLSRGAAVALIAGSVLFGLATLARARRQRSGSSHTTVLMALATTLLGVGIALYVELGGQSDHLLDADVSKLALIGEGLRFSFEHPLLGVGRGAFASTFADLADSTRRAFYPENLVVQWASEWGWPMALLLLGAIVNSLKKTLGEARPATLGAACGLLALGIQNLVDLGLELVGVAVVSSTLLGAVTAQRKHRARHPRRTRALLALPAVGVLAVVVAGVAPREHTYAGQVSRLRQALAGGDRPGFDRNLRIALADHPQEPVFPLLAGAECMAQRPGDAGRWLNRSMSLAPGWVEPHMQAAFWLAQLGRRDQAMLELRMAAGIDVERATEGLCRLVSERPVAGEILRAAPEGMRRGALLDRTIRHCLTSAPGVVATLDADLLKSAPNLIGPRVREVGRLVANGQTSAAVSTATALVRRWPDERAAHIALTGAHSAAGDFSQALAVAHAGVARWPTDTGLLARVAAIEARRGNASGMRATMATRLGHTRGNDEAARVLTELGYHEQELGNHGRAMSAFREAADLAEALPALRRLASLGEASGRVSSALWAHGRICELRPSDQASCTAKERLLRKAIRESAPKPRN